MTSREFGPSWYDIYYFNYVMFIHIYSYDCLLLLVHEIRIISIVASIYYYNFLLSFKLDSRSYCVLHLRVNLYWIS